MLFLYEQKHIGRFSNLCYCTFKFETKNVLMGVFRLKLGKKTYCIIWNQHPRISRNAENCAKQKKIEFVAKVPYLGNLGCKFEKVLSYFKSVSARFCQTAKFRAKSKILNFGTKKCLI